MKKNFYLSIVILAVFAVMVLYVAFRPMTSAAELSSQENAASPAATGPVLVELFTSEGCSDCPAADALLSKIDQVKTIGGANVIVLEQHVDYWDGQGWRDPFASNVFTDRQRHYAFGRTGDQIYTPEMIVDGGDGFIGSDARKAQSAITQAAKMPKAAVHLSWTGGESNLARSLHVSVSPLAQATGDRPLVYFAVTENHLHSDVKRGENAGRSLDHSGVVRHIAQIGKVGNPSKDGFIFDTTENLKLSADWKRPDLHAVVFVQDPKSMRILGSAEIPY